MSIKPSGLVSSHYSTTATHPAVSAFIKRCSGVLMPNAVEGLMRLSRVNVKLIAKLEPLLISAAAKNPSSRTIGKIVKLVGSYDFVREISLQPIFLGGRLRLAALDDINQLRSLTEMGSMIVEKHPSGLIAFTKTQKEPLGAYRAPGEKQPLPVDPVEEEKGKTAPAIKKHQIVNLAVCGLIAAASTWALATKKAPIELDNQEEDVVVEPNLKETTYYPFGSQNPDGMMFRFHRRDQITMMDRTGSVNNPAPTTSCTLDLENYRLRVITSNNCARLTAQPDGVFNQALDDIYRLDQSVRSGNMIEDKYGNRKGPAIDYKLRRLAQVIVKHDPSVAAHPLFQIDRPGEEIAELPNESKLERFGGGAAFFSFMFVLSSIISWLIRSEVKKREKGPEAKGIGAEANLKVGGSEKTDDTGQAERVPQKPMEETNRKVRVGPMVQVEGSGETPERAEQEVETVPIDADLDRRKMGG